MPAKNSKPLARRNVIRDRHLKYFLDFAETAAPHLEGAKQKEWLDRCQRDIFNFRFAFKWAIHSGKTESGYRLVKALYRVVEIRGNLEEARKVADQLLALPNEGVPDKVKAGFQVAAGRLAWAADDYPRARAFYAEAQRLYDAIGDESGAAMTAAFQGFLDRNDSLLDSAERRFQRAIDEGEKLKLPYLQAIGLSGLGGVAQDRGDLEKARELKEQSLAIYERLHDYWIIGFILWGVTLVAIAQKDYDRCAYLPREMGRHCARILAIAGCYPIFSTAMDASRWIPERPFKPRDSSAREKRCGNTMPGNSPQSNKPTTTPPCAAYGCCCRRKI